MKSQPNPSLSDHDTQDIQNHLVEKDLYTPDHIYLDLDLVKDYRLGCLLTFLSEMSPEDAERHYQHIKQGLKDYQLRRWHELMPFMPDIPITEAMIDTRLQDPQYADQILAMAPVTQFIETLKAQININVNHSQVSEKFDRIPVGQNRHKRNYHDVTFYVNTYPLQLTPEMRDRTAWFFRDNYRVNVVMLCSRLKDLPLHWFLKWEQFYLSHLDEFFDNTAVKKAVENEDMTKKKIFAAMLFNPAKKKDCSESHYITQIHVTLAVLDLMMSFDWMANAYFAVDLSYFADPPPTESGA